MSDAVYVLDVIAGFDPRDEATREAAKYIPEDGYKQFLNVDGLSGKRLGIVRSPFLDKLNGSAEVVTFERHVNTLRYDVLWHATLFTLSLFQMFTAVVLCFFVHYDALKFVPPCANGSHVK